MVAQFNPLHDVTYQTAILLIYRLHVRQFGILLDAPNRPEQHVRLVDLINLYAERFALHEFTDAPLGSGHDSLKLVKLSVGNGQTGQRDEHVTRTALEPGITRQHIVTIVAVYDELMGTVHQVVVEIVTGCADIYLKLSQFR